MSVDIARVVNDIRTGKVVKQKAEMTDAEFAEFHQSSRDYLGVIARHEATQVIDATRIYEQVCTHGVTDIYADHVLLPVWPGALIGYVNEFGNVAVVQCFAMQRDEDEWDARPPSYNWESPNEVDWGSVTHQFVATLWLGGKSEGKHFPTIGPVMRWDAACYQDGSIADLRWSDLFDFKNEQDKLGITQNPMLVWLQTYTLAGCTNVELVVPQHRNRAERRRMDRLGANPKTLVIKRTSKSYRHTAGDTDDVIGGVPQQFVRGHFARYGPEFGRGLLFGKYSGKFWIPAHARGDGEHGDREVDYQMQPE